VPLASHKQYQHNINLSIAAELANLVLAGSVQPQEQAVNTCWVSSAMDANLLHLPRTKSYPILNLFAPSGRVDKLANRNDKHDSIQSSLLRWALSLLSLPQLLSIAPVASVVLSSSVCGMAKVSRRWGADCWYSTGEYFA
jgi:hypothetical protein